MAGAGLWQGPRGGPDPFLPLPASPQLGEDHEKTKESSEYLKCLTQQAVALQRTMNEIYRNGSSANIPPLKVRPAGDGAERPLQPSGRGSPAHGSFPRPAVHSPQHGQRLGAAERH